MNYSTPSCVIQKENIPQLRFSNDEVLQSLKKQKLRTHYLERATQLGNLLKTKVKIYFKDNTNRLMSVNTTIWAVTSDFVILKQGVTIPKHSVVYVE
ncbi:hypothetical protein ITJ86_09535 [Winogradskyella sp. F6397]|uniref:DUF2642 domain-containing protein n=1 Tax=Winogradskyella marina TaxID=2785530 RepID=A0ABS0EIQ3_9FLAO|nr:MULTISPECIES: hypothetical protein [Winogradskyella]MBF8150138.1 hypothetical protein [Winogradskyella marina]